MDHRRNILLFNKLPVEPSEAPVIISGSQSPNLPIFFHNGGQKTCGDSRALIPCFDSYHFESHPRSLPSFWTNHGVEPEVTASNQGRHSGSNLLYKWSWVVIEIAGPDDGDVHVSVRGSDRTGTAGICLEEARSYQGRWSLLISTNPAVMPVTQSEQGRALYGALRARKIEKRRQAIHQDSSPSVSTHWHFLPTYLSRRRMFLILRRLLPLHKKKAHHCPISQKTCHQPGLLLNPNRLPVIGNW